MQRLGTLAHRIGPYVHRIQPRTLRGRLALAAAVCSLIGVWATFAIVHTVASRQFAGFDEETAASHLIAFAAFVRIQGEEVEALASGFGSGWSAIGAPSSLALTSTVLDHGVGMAVRSRCSSLLLVDEQGRSVFETGTAEETRVLRSVASRRSGEPVSGLVWAGRALVVACRPVSDAAGRLRGYVAVARPLDAAVSSQFLPIEEGLALTFAAPATTAVAGGTTVAGFSRVRITKTGNGSSRTVAQLPGLLSPSAGTVELRADDFRMRSSMNAAGGAAFSATALVTLLGAVFGLALAAAVRQPIERTRKHLREEGEHALAGLPCEPMKVRPETTREFAALAHEVDRLLLALRDRQNELVAATEHARRAEGSLRSALDDSPEAKVIVENERIVLVNTAAEAMLGLPAERLIGMSSAEVIEGTHAFDEDGRPFTVDDVHARMGQPQVLRLADPSRPERWVELTTVPHSPDPTRVLMSARDITEERRLDELREEIFSLVSHDLRAPLTVVQGYLDILERPLQPEARARALESARHNAGKMADLLEDLLDATAPEELLAPKVMQPVSLCDVAKDVATSMQATAPDHSIVVAGAHDAIVAGEERRLRQAIVNFVSNAIKYAPPHTTVTMRVLARDGRALLVVEDEGPGVPAEAREAVFARYGRLLSAERRPGIGLGLYIVRIIAETHGGSARVEDAPGGGARFVLELPLAEMPPA